ncbi:universal stress protein [Halorubellus sp. PRR65]|uniref:universal stress protein n=1 Tax=Halorubellus sp. PRR65 TaxID=3098148 RepID=UPI002B25DA3F|nr:universal stress protein [Halorubellus sp. PRR65]
MDHPTVLVFVEFPDPAFPMAGFLNNLAYPNVELVGCYHLADDESVEEARAAYEEEFTAELEAHAERFEERGVRTEFDLIFEPDPIEARHRISKDDDVDAILLPGGANTLGKVLIAARHTENAEERMSNLLNIVNREGLISLDLVHVADPDDPDGEAEGERVLNEKASILTEHGVPAVQIGREVRTGGDVPFELNQAARDCDLLVMGETQRDVGDEVFGPVGEYIVEDQDVPVLILR